MANEQLRQRAQEIADEHGNDAYSVALAMLESMSKVKAEAVRESIIFADSYAEHACDTGETWINGIYKYANKLENQND